MHSLVFNCILSVSYIFIIHWKFHTCLYFILVKIISPASLISPLPRLPRVLPPSLCPNFISVCFLLCMFNLLSTGFSQCFLYEHGCETVQYRMSSVPGTASMKMIIASSLPYQNWQWFSCVGLRLMDFFTVLWLNANLAQFCAQSFYTSTWFMSLWMLQASHAMPIRMLLYGPLPHCQDIIFLLPFYIRLLPNLGVG